MPVLAEKEPAPIEKYLEAIDNALIYRYPHVVGPPTLAATALGVAASVHHWADLTGFIVFGVFLLVVLLLGLDSAVKLPAGRERGYGLSLWLGGISWTALAAWFGPWWAPVGVLPVLMLSLGVLLMGGWPPWFKHRRIRRAVDVAKEIGAFNGEAVGLKEVRLSKAGAKADDHSWVAPLIPKVPGTYTLDMLQKAIPRIAARLGCEPYQLTVEKVRGDKEGKYQLRRDYGTRDPDGMHFEVPTEPTSVRKPFPVGVLADQKTPMMIELWRKGHGGVDSIVAGQKGYGKTNFYKRIGVHTVPSHDGLLFIGDMKPGSPDYGDLARGCYAYARTAETIDTMIEALHILCEVRGRNKRPDRKVIVVLLDETSLYFSPTLGEGRQAAAEAARTDMRRRSRWAQLTAISRAFDMALYAATQRCEPVTIGGDNARAALLAGQVVGFFSPKPRDSALISADGKLMMHTLPRGRKGECLISNQVHGDPVRGRQHLVEDAQLLEVVERFAGLEKGLQEDELEALRTGLGERWEALRPAANGAIRGESQPAGAANSQPGSREEDSDSRGTVRAIRPPEPAANPAEPAANSAEEAPELRATSPQESRVMVWDALARIGRPASAAEIAPEVGRGLSLVRGRLAELEAVGCVSRTGHNRWTRYETAINPRTLSPAPASDPPVAGDRHPPTPANARQ